MRCIDIGIEVFFICEMVSFRDLFSLYKWRVCKYDLSLSENPIFLLINLNILSISTLALLNILCQEWIPVKILSRSEFLFLYSSTASQTCNFFTSHLLDDGTEV